MAKEKITYHGLLYDYINYNALIEEQANTRIFLGVPKNDKINYNKPYVKKKILHKKITIKN